MDCIGLYIDSTEPDMSIVGFNNWSFVVAEVMRKNYLIGDPLSNSDTKY